MRRRSARTWGTSALTSEYIEYKIGDILDLKYGYSLTAEKRIDGVYPVYGSNGITGYHNEFKVRGPGIVIGRKGNPGTVTWVDSDFYPIDTAFYVEMKNQEMPLYFVYLALKLSNLPWFSADSAVPGINRKTILQLPLKFDTSNEHMESIVSKIRSFARFLEVSQKTKEISEIIISAIFRSWFIDFDPVKAKAEGKLPFGIDEETAALFPDSFENSEFGPIPAGWPVVTIHDLASQRRDIVNPDELTVDVPYIGLEHMPRHSIALSEWGGCDGLQSNKFRFNTGDILFGKLRPYFHKVGPAPVDGVCSTDILVVDPFLDVDREFLLAVVSGEHFVNYVSGISEGVGLPRTKWNHFNLYKLPLPPVEIREKFSELTRPLLNIIHESIHQSRTLAESRDTLLPKLMSGEMQVPAEA